MQKNINVHIYAIYMTENKYISLSKYTDTHTCIYMYLYIVMYTCTYNMNSTIEYNYHIFPYFRK